ncbi:MAG: hypothetical protein Q7S74_06290 [Nanoarchaeota archaeon]|nr:hypothetical protein [Nanoarchaeota archaeon]
MVYNIPDILMSLESLGAFDYILPFLFVFAIVFGILSSTRFLGDNKAVYVIVSLVIGLMTLRWSYFFSDFLTQIFSRLSIGLAVLLTVLILVGMFINKDETKYWGWGLATLSGVIILIILYQTFDSMGLLGGFESDTAGLIILGVLLVGLVIAVATSGSDHQKSSGEGIFLSGWGKPPK